MFYSKNIYLLLIISLLGVAQNNIASSSAQHDQYLRELEEKQRIQKSVEQFISLQQQEHLNKFFSVSIVVGSKPPVDINKKVVGSNPPVGINKKKSLQGNSSFNLQPVQQQTTSLQPQTTTVQSQTTPLQGKPLLDLLSLQHQQNLTLEQVLFDIRTGFVEN